MRNNVRKNQISQKNDLLHIRISEQEKQKYIQEANEINMNLSQYVLYLLRHKQVTPIEGGAELARELYQLNQNLNRIGQYLDVPTQELRDVVTRGMEAIIAHTDRARKGNEPCQS